MQRRYRKGGVQLRCKFTCDCCGFTQDHHTIAAPSEWRSVQYWLGEVPQDLCPRCLAVLRGYMVEAYEATKALRVKQAEEEKELIAEAETQRTAEEQRLEATAVAAKERAKTAEALRQQRIQSALR
jgi:hypothetical protein